MGHENLIQNHEISVVAYSEVTAAWALHLFAQFKAGKKCEQSGEAEYFVAYRNAESVKKKSWKL